MNTNKKGFTLIELLVVIVIIGILATISVATFGGYFKKARDAERQSAVQNIATIMKVINATEETVDYSASDRKATASTSLDAQLSAQGYATPDGKNSFAYYYAYDADKDDFFIAVCSEESAASSTDKVFSAGTPVGVSMVDSTDCDDSTATPPNAPGVKAAAVTGWNDGGDDAAFYWTDGASTAVALD